MADLFTAIASIFATLLAAVVFWVKIKKKSAEDVGELKKYLDVQVRKSNGVPFAFIENLPVPAWMKDLEGRYIFVNQEYQQVFHCRSVDIEGRTDLELWPESVASRLRYNDDIVLRDKVQLQKVESLPEKPGTKKNTGKILKPWLVTKFPVFGPDKKVVAVGGVAVPAHTDPGKRVAENTTAKVAPAQTKLNDFSNNMRLRCAT